MILIPEVSELLSEPGPRGCCAEGVLLVALFFLRVLLLML
jgi:hypothetical protein